MTPTGLAASFHAAGTAECCPGLAAHLSLYLCLDDTLYDSCRVTLYLYQIYIIAKLVDVLPIFNRRQLGFPACIWREIASPPEDVHEVREPFWRADLTVCQAPSFTVLHIPAKCRQQMSGTARQQVSAPREGSEPSQD